MRITNKAFFTQSADKLAPQLLGKYICRTINSETKRLMITETEAYIGTEDTACHASKGKTQRNKIMWAQGGVCYVYLCYGLHQMLNIVSGNKDDPQAVLIRGTEGHTGPGKLSKALGIDTSLNGVDLIGIIFTYSQLYGTIINSNGG